jgi:hypothetical protein
VQILLGSSTIGQKVRESENRKNMQRPALRMMLTL